MRFMDSVNSSFGIAFGTAASYGCGFIYGAAFHLDQTMVARAFAISAAASLIFKALVNLATGGKDEDPKAFYACHLMGGGALAIIQILAFRQFNLIAGLGTAFLGVNAIVLGLENLHGYYNKS